MKARVKNNTIHLISLKSVTLKSFEERVVEITQEEIEEYKDKITIFGKEGTANVKITSPAEDILNSSTVDDYIDRSAKDVVKSMNEDELKLTDNDLDLIQEYETSHKNRNSVLEKLKSIRGD